MTGAMITNSWS